MRYTSLNSKCELTVQVPLLRSNAHFVDDEGEANGNLEARVLVGIAAHNEDENI